jgi:choline-sulfatase
MSSRPNLLFIMADQYRHDFLGCAGADWVQTPNLDALAARGVRVTQCCSNAPICVPARIGLATGLQPERIGAVDNDAYLPHTVLTYYQRLRDHGYRVGCVGKLDLAKPDPYNGRYGDRPCVYSYIAGVGGTDVTPGIVEKISMDAIKRSEPFDQPIWIIE